MDDLHYGRVYSVRNIRYSGELMLSIASVSSGQAARYYSEKDNYYSNESGYWKGKGAKTLGLEGEVNKDDFLNLLKGKNLDGNQVVQSGIGDHKGERRAAIDLTFSAPKSVSIFAEVIGGDKGKEVVEAHNSAVSVTLEYIEDHYAQARQYDEGRVKRVDTDNLLIGVFRHNLSRELDPQLHTHAVVINQTVRDDGKTVAVEYKEMFDNKLFLGQMYRNELAKNLTDLGYSVKRNEKGFFEINGVDQRLIETFSKRSGQINHEITKLKEAGLYENANQSRLREIAGLGSRSPKHEVNIHTVRESWDRQLNEMGLANADIIKGIADASESYGQKTIQKTDARMNAYDYIRSSAEIITEQESTFAKEHILKTAGTLGLGEYRIGDLEKAFHELVNDKEIILLHEKHNVYTTRQMYELESMIIEKVGDGKGLFHEAMSKKEAQQAIDLNHSSLTEDQKKAVEHILTSRDFVVGVQGSAGTGKTTMLRAVNDEAVKHGLSVRGLAFTGKAADELQSGSGIDSRTIHSFLMNDSELSGNRELWIIDEASMLGSRQIHELLEKALVNDAQIVLVGDIKQLQAIDAGPIFDRLQRDNVMDTVNMNFIVRQDAGYMREIATLIQERERVDSAMLKLSEQNRIHEIHSREERLSAITKDYVSADNYSHSLIVTGTNSDRNDVNNAIRDELKSAGRLKSDEHTFIVRESRNIRPEEKRFANSYKEGDLVYARKAGVIGRAGTEAGITDVDYNRHALTVTTEKGRVFTIDLMKDGDKLSAYAERDKSFMAGDHMVFTKNDNKLGVKNGLRGEITSLNERGAMTVTLPNGREVAFNVNEYSYIDHAYAVTNYKSQGQSVDTVYYHADTAKSANYNEFYVALTRSRSDIHIYTDNEERLKEQVKEIREKTFTQDYKNEKNEMEKDSGRESGNTHEEKDRETGQTKYGDSEKTLPPHETDTDERRNGDKGQDKDDSGIGNYGSEASRFDGKESDKGGEFEM
jgi:conjugative relaxase-like TrwC/TraI family protein